MMTNTKTFLFTLSLSLVLVIFILRIAAGRRNSIAWLEELDHRITPLVLEEIIGAPDRPSPIASTPCVNGDVRDATSTVTEKSIEKEAQLVSGMRAGLKRDLDLLPETGYMGRSYFMRLAGEMEDCWSKLRSPKPGQRRRGELICYSLARQMVKDRGSCTGAAYEVMDRYMFVFADGVRETCLRRNLSSSKERSEFSSWAVSLLGSDEKSVVIFSIGLLGIMGEGSSAEAIGRYRRSADPDIRGAAIWAMGMQGSPDVIGDIEDILSDKTLSPSEGEAFLVALGRIGGMRASGVLYKVMRSSPPLLAYDAYLSLRELRGETGWPLSLEEFERSRSVVADEYAAWLKNIGVRCE